MQKRKYYKSIWADFNKEKEMIFISGARQTGKTTMAKDIASEEPVSHYFNYDVPENKTIILAKPSFFEEIDRKKNDRPLIILDEIHKYKEWKKCCNCSQRCRLACRIKLKGFSLTSGDSPIHTVSLSPFFQWLS
jgi:predicted AAA+ superfamily ATPase